jgi:hypothetical protein
MFGFEAFVMRLKKSVKHPDSRTADKFDGFSEIAMSDNILRRPSHSADSHLETQRFLEISGV